MAYPLGAIQSSLSLLLTTDEMLRPHFRSKEPGTQGLAQNKSVLFPPHQQLRVEGVLENYLDFLPPFILSSTYPFSIYPSFHP